MFRPYFDFDFLSSIVVRLPSSFFLSVPLVLDFHFIFIFILRV
jgi:hypothetical protein